ncbi:HofP DNA utilization family protein [Enterobacter sp. ECC-175]|uniref:HofP DNA utilization family protein n=1 Tax=Enterobacter sp. ECC-175 TaxID=3116479 RepID=UPI00260AA626|nr:HofP DNA utilization family protein [uncultured Enterobacter sp.]
MDRNGRLLLLSALFLLTGMRDPFRPPDDTCAVGQLAQWRYQGIVSGLGIVQSGNKRWHRVKPGDRLPPGWRVISLDEKALVVEVGEGCDPKRWVWQREGIKKDEGKDSVRTDHTVQTAVGRDAKAGHPRGG